MELLATPNIQVDLKMKLQHCVEEEQHDYEKYIQLAEEATTNKEKIILFDIAKEEMRHKQFLMELLNDMAVK